MHIKAATIGVRDYDIREDILAVVPMLLLPVLMPPATFK
jgi:hypothetical protein